MAKGKKRKRKRHPSVTIGPHGFDLGDQQTTVVIHDIGFNQALRDAKVMACAYGVDRVENYPSPIPMVSLVAEHVRPLRLAFDEFARWGCEQDGDVVDVQILLKNDGTYVMAVGPDVDRAMYRVARNHQLLRPLIFNV